MRQGVTVVILVAILLVSLAAVLFVMYSPENPSGDEKPFYVGVAFGGKTVQEAKLLIDRVKAFTNLFVLQSGYLRGNTEAFYEIGDYAVSNNLTFAVYGNVDKEYENQQGINYSIAAFSYRSWITSWIDTIKDRWGDKFLGIYYTDEPGGKLIDGGGVFSDSGVKVEVKKPTFSVHNPISAPIEYINVDYKNGTAIWYYPNGDIRVTVIEYSSERPKGTLTLYFPSNDTVITIQNVPDPTEEEKSVYPEETQFMWVSYGPPEISNTEFWYYPDGDIKVVNNTDDSVVTVENGSELRAQYEAYSRVSEKKLIKSFDDMAQLYVGCNQNSHEWLKNKNVTIFTSDYALYWWDYLGGFDFVLAQLGWNNTVAREIGLVRGAANMQGKSWGTIITWTYNKEPYLASGDTIYEQMKTSYECGAEYVAVFNYAEDMDGLYGILQEEHLQAMEQFWTDVVQDSNVVHGGVEAEAVLVLPQNYGWGMGNPNAPVWGIWDADEESEQIWNTLQNSLAEYGTRLDIVYDSTEFSVVEKYSKTIYWNQTG